MAVNQCMTWGDSTSNTALLDRNHLDRTAPLRLSHPVPNMKLMPISKIRQAQGGKCIAAHGAMPLHSQSKPRATSSWHDRRQETCQNSNSSSLDQGDFQDPGLFANNMTVQDAHVPKQVPSSLDKHYVVHLANCKPKWPCKKWALPRSPFRIKHPKLPFA